jgi:hypothetical protein
MATKTSSSYIRLRKGQLTRWLGNPHQTQDEFPDAQFHLWVEKMVGQNCWDEKIFCTMQYIQTILYTNMYNIYVNIYIYVHIHLLILHIHMQHMLHIVLATTGPHVVDVLSEHRDGYPYKFFVDRTKPKRCKALCRRGASHRFVRYNIIHICVQRTIHICILYHLTNMYFEDFDV